MVDPTVVWVSCGFPSSLTMITCIANDLNRVEYLCVLGRLCHLFVSLRALFSLALLPPLFLFLPGEFLPLKVRECLVDMIMEVWGSLWLHW